MKDLISRQSAIKAINDLPNCYNGYSDAYDKACIIGLLEELPPTQERKNGRWIKNKDRGLGGVFYECSCCKYECSCCKEVFTLINGTPADNLYNFCPNCGAYLKGEEHE